MIAATCDKTSCILRQSESRAAVPASLLGGRIETWAGLTYRILPSRCPGASWVDWLILIGGTVVIFGLVAYGMVRDLT